MLSILVFLVLWKTQGNLGIKLPPKHTCNTKIGTRVATVPDICVMG